MVTRAAVAVCIAAVCTLLLLSPTSADNRGDRHVVVVVGAGLAGLSASIQAVREGARVILLDKEPRHGGNSAKATSGINGVGSPAQAVSMVEDSVELFVEDTLSSGRGLCSNELVEVLAEDSTDAIKFIEDLGIELRTLSRLGGHSAARTHREPNKPDGTPRPVGFDIVSALKKHIDTFDTSVFEFRPNSKVTRLIQDATTQAVTGVEYELREPGKDAHTVTLPASAVILTTGGYSAARDGLLKEHAPEMTFLPSTNGPWAQGEGVVLGKAAGAYPIHLDKVQVHPTGFVDPKDPENMVKFLAPEALRGSGGILLNRKGQRFVDELAPRDTVTGAIYRFSSLDGVEMETEKDLPLYQTRPRRSEAFMILDDQGVKLFGTAAFGFYHKAKGFFTKVAGIKGLAEELSRATGSQISADTVRETFMAYVAAALGTEQDAFGKKHFPTNFAAVSDENTPLYVSRITPSIHYTMGGLMIDAEARIMAHPGPHAENESSTPIPNLFGAGEVTGGVHGANRLAGNSLLECVVFGRIAGRNAARGLQKQAEHDEL